MADEEELKPMVELLQPDVRSTLPCFQNLKTGVWRKISIEDLHRFASRAKLSEHVSAEIRSHFATAQNLVLYSWFVYRFNANAELHALSSVEFALRERLKPQRFNQRSFKHMMRFAVRHGWLDDAQFVLFAPPKTSAYFRKAKDGKLVRVESDSFCRTLVEYLPSRRNTPAHGSNQIWGYSWDLLLLCTDLINQLFEPSNDSKPTFLSLASRDSEGSSDPVRQHSEDL